MKIFFLGFLSICIIYLLLIFVFKVIEKKTFKSFFCSLIELVEVFTSIKFLVFLGITISIFIVFSFLPYTSNLTDLAYISEQEYNIELYNSYTEKYSRDARKQIEEFSEMQKEMAARATAQQLQFWSLQQDEVGNALTERIREFQDNIKQAEKEINFRKSRVEMRLDNKWYFYLGE